VRLLSTKSHQRKQYFRKEIFAVANLTACRVTEVLEHQGSEEAGRNAKPEMVSVNGIELRQQYEYGGPSHYEEARAASGEGRKPAKYSGTIGVQDHGMF